MSLSFFLQSLYMPSKEMTVKLNKAFTSLLAPNDRVLHIRGKRYVLDGSGTTLRPASSSEDSAHQGIEKWKGGFLDRVDIGGVTFTRRNDNTLVRTNTHYARNLLRYFDINLEKKEIKDCAVP